MRSTISMYGWCLRMLRISVDICVRENYTSRKMLRLLAWRKRTLLFNTESPGLDLEDIGRYSRSVRLKGDFHAEREGGARGPENDDAGLGGVYRVTSKLPNVR
jgi:hypothetical protein